MAEPFPDGLQVGQHLARVELVGQRVDHRDGGTLASALIRRCANVRIADRVDVTGQHPGGVLDGLLTAQL